MWAGFVPQAKSVSWFCVCTCERERFYILKDCKQRICSRHLMWPAKTKMIIVKPFTEKVGQPLI